MAVFVSVLRGINVGGHHRVPMEDLRALYEAQGLKNPKTYIQSGNIVFQTKTKDAGKIAASLNRAFEARFGFRADVVLRTLEEMEALVAANPLVLRKIEPTQNIVVFLSSALEPDSAAAVCKVCAAPEEVHSDGRHLFCYYANGQGQSKLGTVLDKHLTKLNIMGTARNWNTVLKLLEMARAAI